jgi:hypothetical protein
MLNKITGYAPVKSTGGAKKTGSAGGVGAFAQLLGLADEAAPVTQLSDVAAASALGNMLSLQEISEEDIRRKKLVQQGKNMLDVLEELRRRLLTGAIPVHMLRDLERHISIQKQNVNDPRLAETIDDIELRVAVELAKLENAFSGSL